MGTPFNTDPAQMDQQRAIFARHLDNMLGLLKSDGVWVAPDPAPLTAREVADTFELAAADPRYQRQHFSTRTVDGQAVTLLNGLIDIHPEPENWP